MNKEIIREHLLSAVQTFLTAFLVALLASIQVGGIEWTGAFWAGVILAAARAAVKEVFARLLPQKLGGRK